MDNKEIKQFIGQLSDEELRLYAAAFIEEDEVTGRKLYDFIKRQLDAVGINNAEASVEESFKVIRNMGDHWHSNYVRDWDSICHDSYTLCERARNAIATGTPDIALAIGTRWLECFADSYDEGETYYYDDEGIYLGDASENAMKIIYEAMTHPQASDNAKKDTAKRLRELADRRDSPFDNYFCIDIDGLAARVNALSLGDDEALTYLDGLLTNDFNNAALIKLKYKQLLKMGRQLQAEAFIEENIDNLDVADYYVILLYEANRFEKLIPILKDLTDPEYETHNRPTRRWLEILADCQDHTGQKDDATDTYRQLFIHSMGDLEYYRILKGRVAPEEWREYLDDISKQTRYYESDFHGQSNCADILLEEGRLQDLHDWLKSKSEGSFARYLHAVPQELRADLIPIYKKQIIEAAKRADKRSAYARVCAHVAKIKELPEGEPVANEIAATIKNKYSTRPAFMDELRKAMAK